MRDLHTASSHPARKLGLCAAREGPERQKRSPSSPPLLHFGLGFSDSDFSSFVVGPPVCQSGLRIFGFSDSGQTVRYTTSAITTGGAPLDAHVRVDRSPVQLRSSHGHEHGRPSHPARMMCCILPAGFRYRSEHRRTRKHSSLHTISAPMLHARRRAERVSVPMPC